MTGPSLQQWCEASSNVQLEIGPQIVSAGYKVQLSPAALDGLLSDAY